MSTNPFSCIPIRVAVNRVILVVSDQGNAFADGLVARGFKVTSISHAAVAGRRSADVDFFASYGVAVVGEFGDSPMAMDTLRSIRQASEIPVMCVTSRMEVTECVVALELGADDFMREPTDELEVAARIRALRRRPSLAGVAKEERLLIVEDIEIHVGERCIVRSGVSLHLTSVEFDLLYLLVKAVGTVVTRDTISRLIFHSRNKTRNRSIDVHMSSLRKKLGDRPTGGPRIRTIRGLGYVYANGSRPT